jgi:hypothetical protein
MKREKCVKRTHCCFAGAEGKQSGFLSPRPIRGLRKRSPLRASQPCAPVPQVQSLRRTTRAKSLRGRRRSRRMPRQLRIQIKQTGPQAFRTHPRQSVWQAGGRRVSFEAMQRSCQKKRFECCLKNSFLVPSAGRPLRGDAMPIAISAFDEGGRLARPYR